MHNSLDPAISSPLEETKVHARLKNQWLVACRSKEVKTHPIGRTILKTNVVLFRKRDAGSGKSKVAALLDRCPHRNAPLSAGKIIDQNIQCPYHGWQFDSLGNCHSRPGVTLDAQDPSCGVPAFATFEKYGLVWIKLEANPEQENDVPQIRNWNGDNDYSRFIWVDDLESRFVDALENLLDATHTPFVHAGLIRNAKQTQQFSATVQCKAGIVEAQYEGEGKQNGWISKIFERDRSSSFGRFVPPCIAELEYTSKRGTEFVLNSYFTPTAENRIRLFSTFFVRKSYIPGGFKRLLLTPFFRGVLRQDRNILRLQHENLQRFDKAEYQYWQGDLLRGWIESWIRTGNLPDPSEKQVIQLNI